MACNKYHASVSIDITVELSTTNGWGKSIVTLCCAAPEAGYPSPFRRTSGLISKHLINFCERQNSPFHFRESIITMTRHGMPSDNCRNTQLNPNQAGLRAALMSRSNTSSQQSREHKPAPLQIDVSSYTQPFLSFISHNPTVFHAVAFFAHHLQRQGFTKLSERQSWTGKLAKGGKYFFERNGSSLVAFVVGNDYQHGNGAAIIASHVDVITTRLKPISSLPTKAGYIQLAVAPYAGGLNSAWWDRDLGIGGRVLVKDSKTGKITPRLVKLGWPIARIPTLAPHFGAASRIADANLETRLVPIIGLDSAGDEGKESDLHQKPSLLGGAGTFTSTQPPRLVKAIALELGIENCKSSSFLFSR